MGTVKSHKKPFQISKDDFISSVTKKSPKAVELLTEYGLHCVNCPLQVFETIEIGAKVHGMNDEEIDKMVKEINEELEK